MVLELKGFRDFLRQRRFLPRITYIIRENPVKWLARSKLR